MRGSPRVAPPGCRTRTVVIVSALVLLAMPLGARSTDAGDRASGPMLNALYEATENVNFAPKNGVMSRTATSALLGLLEIDTPLCSVDALLINPQARTCTVLASGSDEIALAGEDIGRGPVEGEYFVVVNAPGNSDVHIPDCPLSSGKFFGKIDLRPSILNQTPLGFVTGHFSPQFAYPDCTSPTPLPPTTVPFSGTFRLPFDVDRHGRAKKPERAGRAFYLTDGGRLVPVNPDERNLGFPLVRLELRFGGASDSDE